MYKWKIFFSSNIYHNASFFMCSLSCLPTPCLSKYIKGTPGAILCKICAIDTAIIQHFSGGTDRKKIMNGIFNLNQRGFIGYSVA